MNSLLGICLIPVEARYTGEVVDLLESLRARDGADATADIPMGAGGDLGHTANRQRRTSNDGGVVWRPEEYEAFMKADKESYRRVRAFGDVLATAPGQRLTTTRASSQAGIAPTELRAALGKFTTWMKAMFQESQSQWPFGWEYGKDPENPGEFHYFMEPEQAERWRAARAGNPEPVRSATTGGGTA